MTLGVVTFPSNQLSCFRDALCYLETSLGVGSWDALGRLKIVLK